MLDIFKILCLQNKTLKKKCDLLLLLLLLLISCLKKKKKIIIHENLNCKIDECS